MTLVHVMILLAIAGGSETSAEISDVTRASQPHVCDTLKKMCGYDVVRISHRQENKAFYVLTPEGERLARSILKEQREVVHGG